MVLIDDFEDGDITISATNWSGWSDDTANFSATSSSPIAGSFSGLLTSSNEVVGVRATRSSETGLGMQATIRVESVAGSGDKVRLFMRSTTNGTYAIVDFDDGTGQIQSGGSNLQSWSAGTAYDVEIIPDFANDEYDVDIDGTTYGPFTAIASSSGFDEILLQNDTNDSAATRDALIDDVETPQLATPTLSVDATRADEIDLSWTSVTDAEDYELYRAESSGVTSSDTLVTTTSLTSFTDTGLENGERYYYRVRATAGTLEDSDLSNEVDTITTLPAPTIVSTEDTA